ncbi:hypothetical protein [Stutzerimonas azotifigens]|uniref:hypothetical protein n=1 Tax=Stutzerimonas azotifigens TaxID=291995 RepID=UPI0004263FF3|nr:hypothetical protein [Stutzerimonas azotifigens]
MITSDSHSAAVRGPGAGEEAWVLRDLLQAGGVPGDPEEPGVPTQPSEPGEPTVPDQPPPAPVA